MIKELIRRTGQVQAIKVLSDNMRHIINFIGEEAELSDIQTGDYIVRDINGKLYIYSEEEIKELFYG